MPKFTVYFRGLIGKIGLLFLAADNKKIYTVWFAREWIKKLTRIDKMKWSKNDEKLIFIGILGTLLFGYLFLKTANVFSFFPPEYYQLINQLIILLLAISNCFIIIPLIFPHKNN